MTSGSVCKTCWQTSKPGWTSQSEKFLSLTVFGTGNMSANIKTQHFSSFQFSQTSMASEETALWASPGPCSLQGNRWSRSTTCFLTRKIEGHRTPKSSQIIPNRIPFESWCFFVISNNPCRTGLCGLGFKVLAATAAAPWCK